MAVRGKRDPFVLNHHGARAPRPGACAPRRASRLWASSGVQVERRTSSATRCRHSGLSRNARSPAAASCSTTRRTHPSSSTKDPAGLRKDGTARSAPVRPRRHRPRRRPCRNRLTTRASPPPEQQHTRSRREDQLPEYGAAARVHVRVRRRGSEQHERRGLGNQDAQPHVRRPPIHPHVLCNQRAGRSSTLGSPGKGAEVTPRVPVFPDTPIQPLRYAGKRAPGCVGQAALAWFFHPLGASHTARAPRSARGVPVLVRLPRPPLREGWLPSRAKPDFRCFQSRRPRAVGGSACPRRLRPTPPLATVLGDPHRRSSPGRPGPADPRPRPPRSER